MKYKKRRFVPHECMHIYQRTVNGFNIFYDREDFIVFYTIFSVLARFYKVKVLTLCLMLDHIHTLLSSDSLKQVSDFVRHYTSLFAMEFNHSVGRNGMLFHKSFGSAPKVGDKKIRSTIVYIGNNPVEKKLVSTAEEYRWNFLAYMIDSNPFSTPIPKRFQSKRLRRAMEEVQGAFVRNEYLSYARVVRLFEAMTDNEYDVLTDYIISLYYPFDTESLMSYYENYHEMVHAMKSTVGGEYDIKETFYAGSDHIYEDMLEVLRDEMHMVPARRVIMLPDAVKFEMASCLKQRTDAKMFEISKLLHLQIRAK